MLFFQCFDFRKLIFPSDFASTKILYINQDSQNLILAKTLLFIWKNDQNFTLSPTLVWESLNGD